MVVWVARRATESGAIRVIVATDSAEVATVCATYGVESLLTSERHPTGTDRLAEVVQHLNLEDTTVVVNVQGDEPLIPPTVIAQVAAQLDMHPDCVIATAAHDLKDAAEAFNPNVVKVVTDAQDRALYFSRATIPWGRDAFAHSRDTLPKNGIWLRHVGLYAYRAGFLRRFPQLSRAPIEELESLEQLRALWHGERIAVLRLSEPLPPGVDTQEDLERVRALFTH